MQGRMSDKEKYKQRRVQARKDEYMQRKRNQIGRRSKQRSRNTSIELETQAEEGEGEGLSLTEAHERH
jgi:hypothetical protein